MNWWCRTVAGAANVLPRWGKDGTNRVGIFSVTQARDARRADRALSGALEGLIDQLATNADCEYTDIVIR
jgi:hypothetical protein